MMGAYKENFPTGSMIRIVNSEQLAEFARTWKFHHPLQPEQMKFAGRAAQVAGVAFYHGGDRLYTLHGVPGQWHEQCIEAVQRS